MDTSYTEIAQFLMKVRDRSSSYSKSEIKEVFAKVVYRLKELNDLTPFQYEQYEHSGRSALHLGQISELLSARGDRRLEAKTERRLLVSILEIAAGNLQELSDGDLVPVLDILAEYFYRSIDSKGESGVLRCDFILEKLSECFSMELLRRSVQ